MIRISSVPSKKMQQVIRTFLLVKPIFFTNRLIARRSLFVFPLHTLSTPEFRPRTLRDTARFMLLVLSSPQRPLIFSYLGWELGRLPPLKEPLQRRELVVNDMSFAIFRSEKLELLLHTSV